MEAEAEAVDANGRLRAVDLADGRRLEAHILLVAAGIQPNVELAKRRGAGDQPRRARRRPHAHRRPAHPRRGRRRRVRRPAARPVADGGRAGRGRGRHRRRRREDLRPGIVPVTILKVVGIELTSIGRFEATGPTTR